MLAPWCDAAGPIPAAHPGQHQHPDQRRRGKPCHGALAMRQHHQCCQQRPDRLAGIAAHLEQRLRQPEPPARGRPRHPRSLGVEHSRANPDQRRRKEQHGIAVRHRQHHQPDQRGPHPGRQRERHRLLVGEHADERLQQGCGQLEHQRDQADLREIQRVGLLEHWVHRRDQRLHHVVEQMAEAERQQHRKRGARCGRPGRGRRGGCVRQICDGFLHAGLLATSR